MQKIYIIGNLTRAPELRTTASGKNVCSFGVAVNRRFPVDGEKVVDFFNVNAWGAMGEACAKYLDKGKKVAVVGELQARQYEDKLLNKRMDLRIVADEVEFLSPKGERDEIHEMEEAPEFEELPF